MSPQFEFLGKPLVGRRIDHPDRASLFVPIANVNSLLCRVVAKVINVISKVDGGDQIESGPIEDMELPFVASHKELIRLRRIDHALWGQDSRDAVNNHLRADIDNLHRVVAKRGYEKPVASGIEAEMINAAFHIWQGDGSGQNQRSRARRSRLLLCIQLRQERAQQ